VTRLTEMGIEPFVTTSSLLAVLAQRLVRVLCPYCKKPYFIERHKLELIPDFPWTEAEKDIKQLQMYRPVGCEYCNNTGYYGRIGIFEMLNVTERIQNMTLGRKSSKEIRQEAIAGGMQSLKQDGLEKVKQGITSLEELIRIT